jgi:signal transduction histidine kinase
MSVSPRRDPYFYLPLVAAALFGVFALVILWNAFRAQEQLTLAANARLIADSTHRASQLDAVARELLVEATDLAGVHELQTYLVNKALGMSPQYGLNSNLEALEHRFREQAGWKTSPLDTGRRRILFVDADGVVLADSNADETPVPVPPGAGNGAVLTLDLEHHVVISSAPVIFKDEHAGTVFLVEEIAHLSRLMIDLAGNSSYRESLISLDGVEIPPPGRAPIFDRDLARRLTGVAASSPVHLATLTGAGADPAIAQSVAIKTPVASIPVFLLTTIASQELYGHITSDRVLILLGTVPIAAMIATFLYYRLHRRTRKLAEDIAEADLLRRELQVQNQSLSDEIVRRQAAEEALEGQRNRLEELVTQRTAELNGLFLAVPDLYFRVGDDGMILDYRAGREADLYVPPENFLGKKLRDVLPNHVVKRFDDAIGKLGSSATVSAFEYGLTIAGQEKFYEARMIRLDAGQLVVVVRDITDRRYLEDARDAALREAKRLAAVKSDFLANMSHEIRTPLNGVLGMAHVGYRHSDGRHHARDTFAKILKSGKLLLGIVNDILDFSKIEAGMLKIESIPMRLVDVLGGSLDIVRDAARDKRLSLKIKKSPTLPTACQSDPLRVQQVLTNLLANAVKFTEQGSVTLEASCEGDDLVFRVSDTGIGMSKEHLDHLFVPFEQGDRSMTRRFGGTGLGLAISHRIVSLMRGGIQVQSDLGQGTRFEIRLPYIPATFLPPVVESTPGTARFPAGQRLAGLSILVAEDNEINQVVIEDNLLAEGASVVMVGDGQAAVDQVRENGPDAFDLVLMDIQMPVMNGYEATRLILEMDANLPVVGQTAHAFEEAKEECLECGMVDHITKPIDPDRLIETVLRNVMGPSAEANS